MFIMAFVSGLNETAAIEVLAVDVSMVNDSSGWLKHLDIFSATKLRHLALS